MKSEIPKIIHQIWSGIEEPLPVYFKELGKTWREYHSEWKYEFWDNARINSFISEYYPQFREVYNSFTYNIQRWDSIRYLILDKFGGMYVDFDYEALNSLELLLYDKTCCFSSEPEEHKKKFKKNTYFNNALMASVPNHPFIKLIINTIFNTSSENIIYKNKITEVLETTGPLLLTGLYEKYGTIYDIYIIPSELVSPFSKKECKYILDDCLDKNLEDYLEKKLEKALAIHYFIGAWL